MSEQAHATTHDRTVFHRASALPGALVRTAALWATLVLATGCGEFEVPEIVLDLRVMAINAEPPEVVVPIDITALPAAIDDPALLAEILADLEVPDVEVCALVGDPNDSRSLEFTMHACAPTSHRRCDDPTRALADITSGTVEDPEEAAGPVAMCGTLTPSIQFFEVLRESIESDPLSGLSGIEMQVQLTVRPEGTPFEEAEYAAKKVVFSADYPEGKQANQNPLLSELVRELEDEDDVPLPLGRCRDVAPLVLAPGEGAVLLPVEAEGAREDYVLPTFDGEVRFYTENLAYTWYATDGSFSARVTGGPRDGAGNEEPLDTEWTAPEEVTEPLDVSLWLVQRDERGGLNWYESCIRVEPAGAAPAGPSARLD